MRPRPRCLIFNPYFAVLGGGERYTVALGEAIAHSHDVVYASPHPPDAELARQLGFPPVEVAALTTRAFSGASASYDLAVVITLGLPPRSFATTSLLVVQFPRDPAVTGNRLRSFMIRRQLRRYHRVVYSAFARDWLRQRWGVDAVVIHPPVELGGEATTPKARVILAVGRFLGRASDQWNSKRQDVLIDAFAKLPEDVRTKWRLVLAGGVAPSPEMDAYLEDLRNKAKGLDVTLEVNVSPERLQALLATARLFWHASGFDRPSSAPERAEHFGISTAEAMSHRVIPLVFADGGQVEIVEPHCGRLWRSVPELVEQTTELARSSDRQLDDLGAAARAASLRFGRDRFDREVQELIEQIGATRVGSRIAHALRLRWRRLRSRVHVSTTRP